MRRIAKRSTKVHKFEKHGDTYAANYSLCGMTFFRQVLSVDKRGNSHAESDLWFSSRWAKVTCARCLAKK